MIFRRRSVHTRFSGRYYHEPCNVCDFLSRRYYIHRCVSVEYWCHQPQPLFTVPFSSWSAISNLFVRRTSSTCYCNREKGEAREKWFGLVTRTPCFASIYQTRANEEQQFLLLSPFSSEILLPPCLNFVVTLDRLDWTRFFDVEDCYHFRSPVNSMLDFAKRFTQDAAFDENFVAS